MVKKRHTLNNFSIWFWTGLDMSVVRDQQVKSGFMRWLVSHVYFVYVFMSKVVVMMLLRCITAHRSGYVRIYSSMRGLQSCFVVGKLSVCGTTQQWPSARSFTTLLQCQHTSPVQLNVRLPHPLFTAVRFRRRKMNRKPDASGASAEDEVKFLACIVWQVLRAE